MSNPLQVPPIDPVLNVQTSDVLGLASIPFVMAGVEFLKVVLPFDKLPPEKAAGIYPFMSYVVGMALNSLLAVLVNVPSGAMSWGEALARGALVGLVAGLGASGMRSQARATMSKPNEQDAELRDDVHAMRDEVRDTRTELRSLRRINDVQPRGGFTSPDAPALVDVAHFDGDDELGDAFENFEEDTVPDPTKPEPVEPVRSVPRIPPKPKTPPPSTHADIVPSGG